MHKFTLSLASCGLAVLLWLGGTSEVHAQKGGGGAKGGGPPAGGARPPGGGMRPPNYNPGNNYGRNPNWNYNRGYYPGFYFSVPFFPGFYGGSGYYNSGYYNSGPSYYVAPGYAVDPAPTVAATGVFNVEIRVPADDAKVAFNRVDSGRTGKIREFETTDMYLGRTYFFEVEARWLEGGQEVVERRQIQARAGENLVVTFQPRNASNP